MRHWGFTVVFVGFRGRVRVGDRIRGVIYNRGKDLFRFFCLNFFFIKEFKSSHHRLPNKEISVHPDPPSPTHPSGRPALEKKINDKGRSKNKSM